ncbi:SUN domain-containing protein 1-like [Cimex lectularius]|uniref:SUN domain-containing protein n=1 Tax=Cimex lectularius TaxID=79782 RepID=A0A8I6TG35_CIMLE|nr:SUN domain-containing protein 1-like [Cimex lectularius]
MSSPRRSYCEPRCIRVNCVPHCPTCQPHYTYGYVLRSNLKSLGLVIIIAVLAAYVVHCWETNENRKAFHDVQDNINGVHGSLYQKLEKLEGSDSIETLVRKVNSLQADVAGIHRTLSVLGKDECGNNLDLMALKEEIKLFDLDRTGRPDFALENSGGCILTIRDTVTYAEGSGKVSLLGIPLINYKPDPRSIIQKNVSPGECWAFQGEKGTAVIQLIDFIYVTHVTLEHIPKQLSPNGRIDSATKTFSLSGLENVSDESPHMFGQFEYRLSGPAIQTFEVTNYSERAYKVVEFTVHSNHGNPNFTCVYRIRVHGQLET